MGSMLALHLGVQLELFAPVLRHGSDSLSWSQPLSVWFAGLFIETYLYIVLAGLLQGAAFAVVCVLTFPVAWLRSLTAYGRLVGRYLELNVTLLLWGIVGNWVWVAVARDRLYIAYDPVVEWFPFLPYSSSIYDYRWGSNHGHLMNGASDSLLRVIWGTLAIATWGATWLTLKTLDRRTAAA